MKLPDVEGQLVAVDTETTGLHPDDGAHLFCVSAARGERARSWQFESPDEDFQKLAAWLRRQRLVMANGKFDLHMFAAWGVELVDTLYWDVNLATMLLEPREPVGLKETAARAWGGDAKAEQDELKKWFRGQKILKKDQRFDLVPWEIMEPYATQDAALTLRLQARQATMFEELDDWELNEVFDREMNLLKVLYKMEQRGIGFDADACRVSARELQQARDALEKRLPFKPGINTAREFFFGEGGVAIPHRENTATGAAKLTEETLNTLVAEDVAWAAEYQQLRNLEAALTKWYRSWPVKCGKDGRLRTVFNQTNVRSGRLSASRVQMQGIPHDGQLPKNVAPLRSMFRAKEGHELWELDLSQAEVRVAAYFSKCQPMVEALRVKDVHGATAKMVFDVTEDDEQWNFLRFVAKQLTFGMLYGAGPRTIRALIHRLTGKAIELGQVEYWVRGYRQTYPQFDALAKTAQVMVENNGFVTLKGGRRRWFYVYEPSYKGMNAIIQGSVAEVMKEWMIDIESCLPGILLLQIHDSVVIEVPSEHGHVYASYVALLGEQLFNTRFNWNNPKLRIDFVVDKKKWE